MIPTPSGARGSNTCAWVVMMREMFRSIERHSSSAPMDAKHQTDEFDGTSCPAEQERPLQSQPDGKKDSAQRWEGKAFTRLLKNSPQLSLRGAAGDEESRKVHILRARFLAALGMTRSGKVLAEIREAPPSL